MSGSQTYDWMMRMYNREKPWEIFDLIRALAGMRPSETPWTIYAQEVTRKFKELKDLLATTEGNLTDWWQLMLWQRGMPNIPAVHVKLRKASREMVTAKLDLEEWYDTVAKILQNHYEASKTAPSHPHVGQAYQAFTLSHTAACPCCGSHETTAQDEADMAAGALDISKLSEEEIDVADAATAKQHGVEAVRRCYACGRTGHIQSNCPYGCRHCKQKLHKGTGVIRHSETCPERRQGSSVARYRAGMANRGQPPAGLGNRSRPPTLTRMHPRIPSPGRPQRPSFMLTQRSLNGRP